MDKFLRNIFCIVVLFAVSVYGNWSQCGGSAKVSKVICGEVDVEKTVCMLKKGTNATLTVQFETSEAMETVSSVCHGIVSGIPVPFNDIDHKGCDGMHPKCPIVAGTTYTFTTSIFVQKIYPSLQLAIKWEEVNDKKKTEDMWCLMIGAKIYS